MANVTSECALQAVFQLVPRPERLFVRGRQVLSEREVKMKYEMKMKYGDLGALSQ